MPIIPITEKIVIFLLIFCSSDSNGAETVFEYNGDAATKVLNDLNNPKETGSLQKRVFLKLAADGFLTGTVAGTPD